MKELIDNFNRDITKSVKLTEESREIRMELMDKLADDRTLDVSVRYNLWLKLVTDEDVDSYTNSDICDEFNLSDMFSREEIVWYKHMEEIDDKGSYDWKQYAMDEGVLGFRFY